MGGDIRIAVDWRWDGREWLATANTPDRHDLAIMPDGNVDTSELWSDDPPSPGAIDHLMRFEARVDELKAVAIAAVCEARQARLNWKAGPSADQWSLLELRLDAGDAVWLTLHEYETDEYSKWLVRLDIDGRPVEVRRAPAIPLQGAPGDAGVKV